jgi:hypothetical protein
MSLMAHIRRDLEQLLFRDRDPHAIPSMDGALSPNQELDRATPIGESLDGADAVAEAPDGALFVSAGQTVWRLTGDGYRDRAEFAVFDSNAGALAFDRGGRLLTCTERGLAILNGEGQTTGFLEEVEGEPLRCLTAVASAPDGGIFLSQGSSNHAAEDWRVALMERDATGWIVGCGPTLDDARVLMRALSYPAGLAVFDGCLWFSESFAHRLSRAQITGTANVSVPEIVIKNLPGYPSRLGRSSPGGLWLSLFALRTHLVEFVLREDEFRQEMMSVVPQPYWIAPALSSGKDCLEPLQVGGLRALGIEKPWAPPRSYGLVARVDADGEVMESLHSRVGGKHHGVTAAIETSQGVVLVSKGSGRVLLYRSDDRL